MDMSEDKIQMLKEKHKEMFHKALKDSGLQGKEFEAYQLGLADGALLTTRIINELNQLEENGK